MRWVAEHGQAVLDEHGQRLWLDGVILDITEHKQAEEAREHAEAQLREQADVNRHQALHDSLTGLPNRRLFNDLMDQAVSHARLTEDPFALLLLDLDGFKEINDTLGHARGDHLLQEIATRLETHVRGVDSAARLGGDEFAVIMPGSSGETAKATAERIRLAILQPFVLDELSVQVAVSIGIALFPAHGDDSIALMRAADVAMYVAKDTNAGCELYDSHTDMLAPGRLVMVAELRRALEERELILHYQPKVEMRSGRVSGVEALVRWNHPQRGLIPPDEFIPIAEKTDLIKSLTFYVLDEALRQCHSWQELGHPLSVAVNVSTRNLLEADFSVVVAELLEKWAVSPRLLELEITETAIVTDHFRCLAVLEQLSALGVRVSIDDFGTGYTSLAYLRRLPIEEVKVDRSFVTDMARSESDMVIVRSTIELCRNLGLRVVAEGVESGEVWEDLLRLGCDVAQGWLMSRALPADELLEVDRCALRVRQRPCLAQPSVRRRRRPARASGRARAGRCGQARHRRRRPCRRAGRPRAARSPGARADDAFATHARRCDGARREHLWPDGGRRASEDGRRCRRRAGRVQPPDDPRPLRGSRGAGAGPRSCAPRCSCVRRVSPRARPARGPRSPRP